MKFVKSTLASALLLRLAHEHVHPSKPSNLIVLYAAGSASDVLGVNWQKAGRRSSNTNREVAQ